MSDGKIVKKRIECFEDLFIWRKAIDDTREKAKFLSGSISNHMKSINGTGV